MASAPTIYLFRHGETDWNAEKRMQGRADRPLNGNGRAQAAALGMALANEFRTRGLVAADFDYVSSPLSRATETMRIVAEAVGVALWRPEPCLIELDYGSWEGLTSEQVKARFPEERGSRKADRWNFRPAGGESFADVEVRVDAWLAACKRPTVAAAHAGIVRVLMKRAGRLGREEAPRWPVPQGRIFRIDGIAIEMVGGPPLISGP